MPSSGVLQQPASEDPCIYNFDSAYSYAQVEKMAVFLATVFADGEIGLGGSNHAHTPEYPQALIASLAIWMRGRGVVPVNPNYITKDIAHLLSDSGARWIMCEEAMFEKTEGICFSE